MKKILYIALALVLAGALATEAALAKRMGGGGSFGSKSSYSRSYSPSTPSYAPTTPSKLAQQTTQATPQTPVTQPQAPGMFSRMGWGLGGLLAGGLLGSMLFGGGGWGSGGGIGILEILLIGLVVYLGYRFLRSRSASANPDRQAPLSGPGASDPRSRAEQSWDQSAFRPESAGRPRLRAAPRAASAWLRPPSPGHRPWCRRVSMSRSSWRDPRPCTRGCSTPGTAAT